MLKERDQLVVIISSRDEASIDWGQGVQILKVVRMWIFCFELCQARKGGKVVLLDKRTW